MNDERFKLVRGDCLRGMRFIESESVDVVMTDPPFSSGATREAGKVRKDRMLRGEEQQKKGWFDTDSLSTTGFVWLLRECALEWHRILRPGGSAFVFIDWRMATPLGEAIESADLLRIGVLVWDKVHFKMGNTFRKRHEFVLHFSKGQVRPARRHDVPDDRLVIRRAACTRMRRGAARTVFGNGCDRRQRTPAIRRN